jgi:glutamate/tyrosine decarboxylase-like PLP-dependent enzyme
VDGAYGAYFRTLLGDKNLENHFQANTLNALNNLSRVDSITLDPHKLGYIPYACGAILVRSEQHYQVSRFTAPYLQVDNNSAWVNTLEGSRAATGAVATWFANKCVGLDSQGYGQILDKGFKAKYKLERLLIESKAPIVVIKPFDTNILCFAINAKSGSLADINLNTKKVFDHFSESPHFSVSRTTLGVQNYNRLIQRLAKENSWTIDSEYLVLLRIVMMNPFIITEEANVDYLQEFVAELKQAIGELETP